MHKQITANITGISPILFHNGMLADPLNPVSQAMKKITSKKKKTEDDYALLSDLEFIGGLTTDDDIEFSVSSDSIKVNGGGSIVVTSEYLESVLINAAKKSKRGMDFKAAVFVELNAKLEYDGPKTVKGLVSDKRFRDCRGVRVQRNRVIRTRPIFRKWALQFTVSYLPDIVNREDVVEAIKTAGMLIGIGDHRPKYGRFQVDSVKDNGAS